MSTSALVLNIDPEPEVISVLREALAHGVHVDDCPMLHPMVHETDWKKCGCWYGRARKLVETATPRQERT